jgi:hypothetical protein
MRFSVALNRRAAQRKTERPPAAQRLFSRPAIEGFFASGFWLLGLRLSAAPQAPSKNPIFTPAS